LNSLQAALNGTGVADLKVVPGGLCRHHTSTTPARSKSALCPWPMAKNQALSQKLRQRFASASWEARVSREPWPTKETHPHLKWKLQRGRWVRPMSRTLDNSTVSATVSHEHRTDHPKTGDPAGAERQNETT
jgi:hypothetical protein